MVVYTRIACQIQSNRSWAAAMAERRRYIASSIHTYIHTTADTYSVSGRRRRGRGRPRRPADRHLQRGGQLGGHARRCVPVNVGAVGGSGCALVGWLGPYMEMDTLLRCCWNNDTTIELLCSTAALLFIVHATSMLLSRLQSRNKTVAASKHRSTPAPASLAQANYGTDPPL